MTSTQAPVRVEQADRNAAVPYLQDEEWHPREILAGAADAHWLLQLLARHRCEATLRPAHPRETEGWLPIESAPQEKRCVGIFKAPLRNAWEVAGVGYLDQHGIFRNAMGAWGPVKHVHMLAELPPLIAPEPAVASEVVERDANDTPEARLEMVRVAVQAIIKGNDPVPLAKAALDFIDLTQAEREAMRGEQPRYGASGA